MDPGNFITDSGSKIPLPAREIKIPSKPKPQLVASGVKKTDFVLAGSKETKPVSNLAKARAGVGKSIPNLAAKPTVTRSKTGINRAATNPPPSSGVKRIASETDLGEATIAKVPKIGLPYKAKTWELKLRLAECEEWFQQSRLKVSELEGTIEDNAAELEGLRDIKKSFDEERSRANVLKDTLKEKTDAYDKLVTDSKTFLDKIHGLEQDLVQKQQHQKLLEADLSRLREESLSSSSEISKLKFSLDDLEFKFKRQKNTLEDTENLYNESKKEISSLQSKLRERDGIISDLRETLEKTERDNKFKANTISDLEAELSKAKSRIQELERNVSSTQGNNEILTTDLAHVREELTTSKLTISRMTTEGEEMRTKLCENEKLRRYLHNQVQDLKGNIRVFCRVRPALQSEKENCVMCSINYPDEGSIVVAKGDPFENHTNNTTASRPKFQKHEFSFDRVFNPSSSQQLVFEELSQLVQSALDGYNVCIFAYGQTGSGKTYTMEGPNTAEGRGMIPRTVQHIFNTIAELQLIGWEYTVEVCFIEIYNEVIRDLLRNDKEGSNLKIMQVDGKTNDVVIPGLTVIKVNSCEDLDRLYLLAHQNRIVASTSFNERSSRSHSVTKIKVTGVLKDRGETCYGSLNLVDLAGSERLSETSGSNDSRLREMKNINKSLSELGNVILGLYQKNEHIPYRNSKLTHLLQPALGGSSKTLMLVNISPAEGCLSETLCSLRFAQKVNQVKVASSKKRITYEAPVAPLSK